MIQVHKPAAPLSGAAAIPGDKSISHRVLILAALSIGTTHVTGLLDAQDTRNTAAALRALGAKIDLAQAGATIRGRGIGGLVEPEDILDMGNSGTATRLLCGVLATHPVKAILTGDASLRRRPMRRVIDPLLMTGASIQARAGGLLPLTITGTSNAVPLDYTLPVASAQVKSAILLAGLNARGTTRVTEPIATRDHSENLLRHFGAVVEVEAASSGKVIQLQGQPELRARPLAIPGDPSSAAFPLVAALLVPGSEIRLGGVCVNPLRTGLFDVLRRMNAELSLADPRHEGGEPVADLIVRASSLVATETQASEAPSMIDEFPILAVAAAHARGTTRLCGLGELRVKESDRLAATAALLHANGVTVAIDGDDLLVSGTGAPPPGGGHVLTQMDHRLAMSGVVLGLAADQPVSIDDTGFIDTSFPGFFALMNHLGAGLPA